MHMVSYYCPETPESCVCSPEPLETLPVTTGFWLADKPTIFQEKIDHTLEKKQPASLDDIIVETKGSKGQYTKELVF